VYLNRYILKNGDRMSVWRAMELKDEQTKEIAKEAYLDTLPQEMVDRLSAPETGGAALLEELNKFVEDNRIFKEDMLELLNYLASDQCVHGYDDLVADFQEFDSIAHKPNANHSKFEWIRLGALNKASVIYNFNDF
ncbi:hypothetical protein BGX30_005409, partial [Mortierella sp. GBA39]